MVTIIGNSNTSAITLIELSVMALGPNLIFGRPPVILPVKPHPCARTQPPAPVRKTVSVKLRFARPYWNKPVAARHSPRVTVWRRSVRAAKCEMSGFAPSKCEVSGFEPSKCEVSGFEPSKYAKCEVASGSCEQTSGCCEGTSGSCEQNFSPRDRSEVHNS